MNPERRSLIKLAMAIRADLAHRQRPLYDMTELPVSSWNDLVAITRRFDRAVKCGWYRAAARLAADQTVLASCLQTDLAAWIERRRNRPATAKPPNGADLFQDLVALENEFGEVGYEGGEEFWVTTEPIELDGISLGRFQIRFKWLAADDERPYRLVALDPNPASRDADTTHPHVQYERLCEGDGARAIHLALQGWRLYDLFLLINQILHTYSPGHAFVDLCDWDEPPCSDCGQSVSEDDRCHCEGCSETLCRDCATMCAGCGYDFCSRCISICAHCDTHHCRSCLSACVRCQSAVCSDCQNDDHHPSHETLCRRCHERETADAGQAATMASSPTSRTSRRASAAV
jgi:hypothetical protein